jgi:hypothetical protein
MKNYSLKLISAAAVACALGATVVFAQSDPNSIFDYTTQNSNNVPEIREMNYAAATAWLKSCAEGDVTADIPVILPRQGNRIRHGGVQKQYNHY